MRRSPLRHLLSLGLLAPWLTLGCTADPEPDPVDPDTLPPFARDMLEGHNAARAAATPAPTPALEALGWDAQAEATAKAWAENCDFTHNPDRGDFGENLAAATPDYWDTREVVEGWASEAADYDYEHNACQEGKVCGHYTQVVWRNTKRVGCAVKTCTKNTPFGDNFPTWQFWVCNYAPPGNYIGQKPY